MYTKGSNALKREYYTYDTPRTENEIKENKEKSTAIRKHKSTLLLKKRIVAAVGLVAMMAFVILTRYAAIAKEFSELSKTRSELALINAQVVETRVKAEGNIDPKKIELEAQRLNLHQPAKSQIKYISLGNTDNGEVLKAEKTNGFSAFINRISVILEYLY